MTFKTNKYTILKGAISREVADFAFAYFLNKRKVAKFLFESKIHFTIYRILGSME